MAELWEFLANIAEDSDPELPPGAPPTCEFLATLVSAC